MDYMNKAKQCVLKTKVCEDFDITLEDLYVVWFSKTLKNFKALISTDKKSGWYFEVTHNGCKKETYVDVYYKADNICVKDGE